MKNLPRYGLGILAVLGIIGTAACGDDGDDRLTDEEYFTQLDNDVYQEFDRALEEEVFGGETAGEAIDDFLAAVDTLEEGIRDLQPPEDLEENHDRLLEGVDAATDFLEQAAEGVEDDTPIEELETILV